jgi:hypothetical protein
MKQSLSVRTFLTGKNRDQIFYEPEGSFQTHAGEQ